MLSKVKEYYHDGMAVVITNPKYYIIASIVEMVILVLIIYKWSPLGISEKYPALANIFVLMFGFFQVLTYLFVQNKDVLTEAGVKINVTFGDVAIKILFTLLTVCLSVLFIYIFVWMLTSIPSIGEIFSYAINIFIVFGAIALIYMIFLPVIKGSDTQKKTFLSLAIAFIMYIPCAMIDLVEWFKYQYNITTNSVLLLLALEVILITLSILIPKLITFMVTHNGTLLLRYPVYLDKPTQLGSYEVLHEGNVANKAYRYSLSAWFWINPQPPNTRASYNKWTNIFEFARKPAVEYYGGSFPSPKLRVNCHIKDDEEITIYETDEVNYQTWNNIVINYDGATMDVFLNGVLVGSKPNIAPYITMENINVGAERGIEGGICNVVYHKDILQERHIQMAYKTLKRLPQPIL